MAHSSKTLSKLSVLSAVLLFSASANAQTVESLSHTFNDDISAGAIGFDAKFHVGGEFSLVSSQARNRLARLNADGTLDSTFVVNATTPGTVISILVHPDGSLLVGGNFTEYGGAAHADLARITATGAIDTAFTTGTDNGQVNCMALQADGKVVVGGTFATLGGETHTRIGRLNANGSIDSAFTASANGEVLSLLIQGDGKIVVAGQFTDVNGTTRNGIARLNADGTLDTGFNPNIGGGNITGMAQHADGKILVYGNFSTVNGAGPARYARLNSDGTRDTAFTLASATAVSSMMAQSDGKILVAGTFSGTPVNGQAVIRVESNGAVDSTFTPVAVNASSHVILDGTGKIYIAGTNISSVGGEARAKLARLSNPTAPTSTLEFSTNITWSLGASAPIPTVVRFQTSANGTTWADLGGGTLTSGVWRLNSPTLPAGTTQLRAVGVVPNNGSDSSLISASINVTPAVSRLLNISSRAQVGTGDNVMIPGFVLGGTGTKRVLIRGVGPTLGVPPFNIAGVLPNPKMILRRRDTSQNPSVFVEVATNDEWQSNTNASDITAAGVAVSAFDLGDAHEAALLVNLTPGEYTVVVDDAGGATGVAICEAYDADTGTSTANLMNISNRGFVGEGAQVMIPGFVISSEGPKTVLIRAVGPTLGGAPFNVAGTMPDPKIELYQRVNNVDTLVTTQDNWGDHPDVATTVSVSAAVSAFTLQANSKDAAFVATLQPGSYTAVCSSAVAGQTGVALVEVYVAP